MLADFDFERVACAIHGIGPNRFAGRPPKNVSRSDIEAGPVRSAYKRVTCQAATGQWDAIMRTGVMQCIHLFTQSKDRDFSSGYDDRLALAVRKIIQRAEWNAHRRRWRLGIRE